LHQIGRQTVLKTVFEGDVTTVVLSALAFTFMPALISILDFAYLLGFKLYDWQAKILLRYEAGDRTAVRYVTLAESLCGNRQ
jgi:hypothetical protein